MQRLIPTRRPKAKHGLVSMALLAAATVGLAADPAGASPLDASCAGTQTVTYSPGVTLVPTTQTVHLNTIFAPCVSLTHRAVVAGTSDITVSQKDLSCASLAQPGSSAGTFQWNTGQTSKYAFNRTSNNVGGQGTVINTGMITEGLFAGDTAAYVMVGPSLSTMACLMPGGITSRTGVVTLEITSITAARRTRRTHRSGGRRSH